MRDFISYRIARKLRRFQSVPLPDELLFDELWVSRIDEEAMYRDAGSCEFVGAPVGVFEVVGMEYVERARRAWRPRELFLMLLLKKAFEIVEQQCHRGILVPDTDRERLIALLTAYYEYVGGNRPKEQPSELVEGYISRQTVPEAITAEEAAKPIVIRHPLLDELRRVDIELRERFLLEQPSDQGLMALGLGLYDLEDLLSNKNRYDYLTPINCRVFATTGGDGVHYSFLLKGREITAESLVVCTWPDGSESHVVGENLYDFLCRGARGGYFALPHFDEATDDPERRVLLEYLAERLNLNRWTDPDRYKWLMETYDGQLQLPAEWR